MLVEAAACGVCGFVDIVKNPTEEIDPDPFRSSFAHPYSQEIMVRSTVVQSILQLSACALGV